MRLRNKFILLVAPIILALVCVAGYISYKENKRREFLKKNNVNQILAPFLTDFKEVYITADEAGSKWPFMVSKVKLACATVKNFTGTRYNINRTHYWICLEDECYDWMSSNLWALGCENPGKACYIKGCDFKTHKQLAQKLKTDTENYPLYQKLAEKMLTVKHLYCNKGQTISEAQRDRNIKKIESNFNAFDKDEHLLANEACFKGYETAEEWIENNDFKMNMLEIEDYIQCD